MTAGSGTALTLLTEGTIEVLGLLPHSSNYTFLARVSRRGEDGSLAVYKPRRGEQPLWDFPSGNLAGREVAAYAVSEAAGWGLVPATVLREEAPLGAGSLQLFIEHDPERHYLVLMEDRAEDLDVFAVFDFVINNADRKSGHVLEDANAKLWAVDHGVTFHPEPKLRTVIWEYAGRPLPAKLIEALAELERSLAREGSLGAELIRLLDETAWAATRQRVATLLATGRFPQPSGERPYPWPLV